jgi:hypothetical protein
MSTIFHKLSLALFLITTASACTTVGGLSDKEALIQAGASRLNATQVKAHVTGKTEEWRHGGGYYLADGELKAKWRKVYLKGSWEVSTEGDLCYQLPKWEKRCHVYMEKDGDVYLLDEGKNLGVRYMHEGDKLVSLGRDANGGRGRN